MEWNLLLNCFLSQKYTQIKLYSNLHLLLIADNT